MAADGDLSYGSYQENILSSMQHINISFFERVITQIRVQMDLNRIRASSQNLEIIGGPPNWTKKGQIGKIKVNDL